MTRNLIIIGLVALCSCSRPAAEEPQSPKEALRARLETLQDRGLTAFGHHDDPVYGHTWWAEEGRSDVLETAGEYPAVMSWDLGGLETGDSLNLDSVPFSRIRAEVLAQDARGGINVFSWHLRNPVNGGDSWNVSDSTVVAKMVNDSITNAAFRAQLRTVATFFNSLTDSTGRKVAAVFRPWHEHTGGWFWWGAPLCSADDYKALWAITRDELDKAGVDNVLYAYSPDRVSSEEQYLERYPGDEYIDILGTDIYHFNGEEGIEAYRQATATALPIVRAQAKARGKIAAFTETGLEGLTVPGWYTDVLLPVLRENPVAYVVVWRNAYEPMKPGHFYAPYPGHPSEQSFKTFHNDSSIVFVNKLADL